MISAIIQARTTSTRLPGKIFLPIKGKPLIWHVCNRLTFCKEIDEIIVATTNDISDDQVESWCQENSINFFRGSLDNVLKRYYEAAKKFNAKTIIRITCDDPFKDAQVIDDMIKIFYEKNLDFLTNNNPPSFPEGLDVEIFSYEALEIAVMNAESDFEQEHVTQYFYRNQDKFKLDNFSYNKDISEIRLTVDTQKDLDVACAIYDHLYQDKKYFDLNAIINFITTNNDILQINQDVKRSFMYQKGR